MAIPCNPLSPCCMTLILPIIFTSPLLRLINFRVPLLSVTKIELSGKNANAQGTSRFWAMIFWSGISVVYGLGVGRLVSVFLLEEI